MNFLNRVIQIADPRGRCNRKALLGVAVALLAIQALAVLIHAVTDNTVVHIIASAFELACLWIATSAAIKRLHDVGMSGWWVPGFAIALFVWMLIASFVSFLAYGEAVAVVGSPEFLVYASATMIWPLLATVWMHFAKGMHGPNKYGPEPDESGLSAPGPNTELPLVDPQPI